MTVIDFVLGMFIGVFIVSALVVIAVIILEPGHRRTNALQAQVGNTQKRKPIPVRGKPSVFSRIMHAWGKGAKPKERQQEEGLTGYQQSLPPALTADTQEPKIDEVSPPMGKERLNNELLSNLKPDEDVKSASEEGVNTSGIDTNPPSQAEAASTEAAISSEKRVEMVNIPHKEEDEPAKYSPEEDESHPKEKGDWASAFTDIQVEESQASKLAKSLDNVDIYDLLARCQSLIKPSRNRKP